EVLDVSNHANDGKGEGLFRRGAHKNLPAHGILVWKKTALHCLVDEYVIARIVLDLSFIEKSPAPQRNPHYLEKTMIHRPHLGKRIGARLWKMSICCKRFNC